MVRMLPLGNNTTWMTNTGYKKFTVYISEGSQTEDPFILLSLATFHPVCPCWMWHLPHPRRPVTVHPATPQPCDSSVPLSPHHQTWRWSTQMLRLPGWPHPQPGYVLPGSLDYTAQRTGHHTPQIGRYRTRGRSLHAGHHAGHLEHGWIYLCSDWQEREW